MSAPSKAKAGQVLPLSGQGFSPGTPVKIVFDDPKDVVVGTAVAQANGDFHTSVVVPKAQPGRDKFQVVGTSSSGRPASLATPVLVLADATHPANRNPQFPKEVLISLSIALPLATWLVLQMLGWRHRRVGQHPNRS
ncbi:MAG TPA: hypothetical protein VEJ84_23320 [Acidimicrobiales bacterium]|nr:hypothetical protein [Acidimicrobiales bacterium]